MIQQLFIICPLVFFAGFVDSIAGGGGLISLPAYYAAGVSPYVALGSNKFASSCGTFVATFRFIKNGKVDWNTAVIAVITALTGSYGGSRMVQMIDEVVLRTILIIALPVITIFLLKNKNFNQEGFKTPLPIKKSIVLSGLAGLIIGCYDGFFGPGTGTFLIIVFNTVLGLPILIASGNAKVVNLASNVAALAGFLTGGNVWFALAIPAALFGVAGNYLGAGMALKKGMGIVRPISILVILLLLGKILWDLKDIFKFTWGL